MLNKLNSLNTDMESQQTSKGNPYLMQFIKDKGGAAPVARRTGIGYQTVVQIEKGRNGASQRTLAQFAAGYPDFDLIRANTGKPAAANSEPASLFQQPDALDWEGRFVALEKSYHELRGNYEKLMIEYRKVVEQLMRKLDPSFNLSDSQFTALPADRELKEVYGLVRYEGRVVTMPTGNTTSVRRLNSRKEPRRMLA